MAFSVAGGVLRAPPLTLRNEAATVEADVGADLNSGEVSVDGTVSYRPGVEALVGSEPALRFSIEGPLNAAERVFDSEPLAQFLTQRALEAEQARVEAMQASLLEKQRLRREVRYYAALQREHDAALDRLRRQEEARQKAEQEARLDEQAERQRAEARRREAEAAAQREAGAASTGAQRPPADSEAVERAPLPAPAEPQSQEFPALDLENNGFMQMLEGGVQ